MTNDEFFAFCDMHQIGLSFAYEHRYIDNKKKIVVCIDSANTTTRLLITKGRDTYQEAIEACKEFAKEFEAAGFDIHKRYY